MIIFTGRFQPFHNGHLSLIKNIKEKYPNEVICLAIVRDVPIRGVSEFDLQANKALCKSRNILSAEDTLRIIQETICDLNYKNVIATLIPRPSDEVWYIIESMFDSDRIWAFTCNTREIDEWEKIKIEYYKSKAERVEVFPIDKNVSGTTIREMIRSQKFDKLREVLPKCVFEFIKHKCNM